jgi:mannose-6-phosphate isomerase-like protein (cupin superfamily)
MKTSYKEMPVYITKDGSEIRELMHPGRHPVRNQSLAEAVVQLGERTQLHRHAMSEELYYVTAGSGEMTLGDVRFNIEAGDTVLIPPGTPHCVEAKSTVPLRILCCCSPAYSHDDTEILSS